MMRHAVALLVLVCGLMVSSLPLHGQPAERLFEVLPPEQLDFNYPSPPREGRADYFAIAEDGKARCVILRPANARNDAVRAAATLKTYLDLVTGANIPSLVDGATVPAGMAAIHVGDTSVGLKTALDLPPVRYGKDILPNVNGFLIVTPDPQTMVIRGQTERATMLGVVSFLKRYAGVRHYWQCGPGGLGDVVPHRATLRLPEIEWRDWPYFVSRIMSGLTLGGPNEPVVRNVNTGDFFRMNYTIPSNESYYKWLTAEEYGQTHPEYFPLHAGKRFIPQLVAEGAKKGRVQQGWQPCVSNPEVADVMARALIDHFRKNPEAIAINLAVNDGQGDCECEKCRAMDAPNSDYANRIGLCDRYITFSNRVCDLVAKEFPDKIIAFIAYGSMRLPPKTVQLHPMLMPVLTMGHNVNAFQSWDSWMKMGAQRMGIYLYHNDIGFFILPKLDIRQSAKRIRYIIASGRARHFYQEMYPYWPIDSMVAYVENELLWDPRQDVDAILDEHYTLFFGPAAAPMKDFYTALESGYERWIEEEGAPHWFGKDLGSLNGRDTMSQFKVLTVAEADRATDALKRAAAMAQGDEKAAARVEIVKGYFGFCELGAHLFWTTERLKAPALRTQADAQRVVEDARRALALSEAMAAYKRDVLSVPPLRNYVDAITSTNSRNALIRNMETGKTSPDTAFAIASGFASVNEFLRKEFGPAKAASWWTPVAAAEENAPLAAYIKTAKARAAGVQLANLVRDPSLEERGAGTFKATGRQLDPEHEDRQGLSLWYRRGTPFNWALTTDEAHTGKYSLCFSECALGSVSESLMVSEGQRLAVSVWLKHNDEKGSYTVAIEPRQNGPRLPYSTIEVPFAPEQWQEVTADITIPKGATRLVVRVMATYQAPGAKVWIDDFFIGRYPD